MSVLNDPRVRALPWRDLTALSRGEVVGELLLSLPWLLLSLICAGERWYLPALLASFMFFLTGLRQTHNAYHYALGLPRLATELVMLVLSVLMLGSMHAVKINHLRHHRDCLGADDVEAIGARLPAWKAIAMGPLFPWLLHVKALQVASPADRRWIVAELTANLVGLYAVFVWLELDPLRYHVAAMAVGQCLTCFFAVWTVHHDCDAERHIARTMRNRFKSLLSYDMFFHVEHHLFPKVPTRRLPIIAQRLDAVAPELCSERVF